MASESDLKLEIEQLRSELAISEKLESKSRERQLELEAQNAKMKKEFQSLRSQLQGETDMESVVQSLEEEIVELNKWDDTKYEINDEIPRMDAAVLTVLHEGGADMMEGCPIIESLMASE